MHSHQALGSFFSIKCYFSTLTQKWFFLNHQTRFAYFLTRAGLKRVSLQGFWPSVCLCVTHVQYSFSVSPPTSLEHDFLSVVWIQPWQLQSAADTLQLDGSLNHFQPSLGWSVHLIPGRRLWWHIAKRFNPYWTPPVQYLQFSFCELVNNSFERWKVSNSSAFHL